VLSGKDSKFSITFKFCTFPDSVSISVIRVLRYHCQSESESVLEVLLFVYCVPTSVSSSLLIGLERTRSEWKVEEVNYKFGIVSFLR
jgi:hypothetical protein